MLTVGEVLRGADNFDAFEKAHSQSVGMASDLSRRDKPRDPVCLAGTGGDAVPTAADLFPDAGCAESC